MKRAKNQPGKGALDLIEEAVHLLRTAPLGTLVAYYVGALPFVLGGLYFWADMSRSPYAAQHMAGATLGMAGLFVWMKFWQTVFARQMRAQIARETAPLWNWRRCGHMLLNQTALQSTGLFVLPLASVPILPTGWVYAFYQNLTVLDNGESGELRVLLRKARRQAGLWSTQNHMLLGLLLGFGFVVFLNWGIVCYALPGLLKMLFGVESMFTRVQWRLLNTTFFAAIFGLSYLCMDPIAKAAYALRCFYGESVQSGEDLRSGLREFLTPAKAAAVAGVVMLLGIVMTGRAASLPVAQTSESAVSQVSNLQTVPLAGGAVPASSQPIGSQANLRFSSGVATRREDALAVNRGLKPTATVSASLRDAESAEPGQAGRQAARAGQAPQSAGSAAENTSVSPPKLDATIGQVIQESKYAWRAPRDEAAPAEDMSQGVIGRFLERVWNFVKGVLKSVLKGLGKCLEWLGKWLDRLFGRFFRMPASSTPGYGWVMGLHLLLYVLVAGVIFGLGYLAWRIWRNRRPPTEVIASEAILPVPDVADENVGADQLPEDGWMKLARELLARGELRLALRAFYLASLAHLAERNLISIARFKSNREYERELRRRGHAFPELLAAFGENVTVFDSIWYGLHEVNPELVNAFAGRVEQLKGAATGGQPAGGTV